MTDFPNLKAKCPDLIPARMYFQYGPGWEHGLDKYFREMSAALPGRALQVSLPSIPG